LRVLRGIPVEANVKGQMEVRRRKYGRSFQTHENYLIVTSENCRNSVWKEDSGCL
jgi:hypothetical protein